MENNTGVVDSPQDTPAVEDASTNDLRNFLAAQTESQVPEQEPQNLETQPEEANPLTETEETIVPPDEPVSEEERLAKRRIRPKSNEDQQVIDLYRSEGFEGTFADASSIFCCWSSKKISASNDFKNSDLFMTPKKRDSSILTPHILRVLITRL